MPPSQYQETLGKAVGFSLRILRNLSPVVSQLNKGEMIFATPTDRMKGKLADNKWTKVTLKEKAAELDTNVLAVVLVIVVTLVVVLVIFRKKFTGIQCSNGRAREKTEERQENIKMCQEATEGGKNMNLELGIVGKQDTQRTRQINELTKTVEKLNKTVEEVKAENAELTETVKEVKVEMAMYKRRLSEVSQLSITSLQESQVTSVEFCADVNHTNFQSSHTRSVLSTSTESHPRTNTNSKPYKQSHSHPPTKPPTHPPTHPPTKCPTKPSSRPPTYPPTYDPSSTADKRPPRHCDHGTNSSKSTLPIKPTKPTWVDVKNSLIKSPNQPPLN